MIACRACASDNPEGAKFCNECGAPLGVRSCPECGARVERGRFCNECGAALEPGPSVPSQAVGPVAERRVTSILFADLVGFTPLSETRDAEEVRELLSGYFTECRTVIARYGGVVEKFIGDAVMAVWGVPIAHEDDAERSVRAALELVDATGALGDRVGAPGLTMRVGIMTGEVAVTVGATAEGMVAGDAVNTASRIQSTAAPGQVWVDDRTRALSAAAISYSDAGRHALKGKEDPVHLWRAGAVVASVGGGQRLDGLEAALVGRERELRALKDLFHATEESRLPRLVILDGEAGVGKSRLAWEFEKYIDGLATTTLWHRGRCLSYGEGVAFWALTEAVRNRLGLTEADVGPIVDQRLDAGLNAIVTDPGERDWLRPRLAALIGADAPTTLGRDDLFAAWTTFLERVGGDDPVVFVVDDAQYADDGLLDFIDHLLATAQTPILVIALARPELLARRPELGGRRGSIIKLEPLNDAVMASMLDHLVTGLPDTVRATLVTRAEGVPLFAVETVRALIDRDAVIPIDGRYVANADISDALAAIGAPASLHALIAARLDALTPSERQVIADASVLGLTFTREGIEALTSTEIELEPTLTSLRRKEILTIQTDRFSSEQGQYRFVQALVRQVAYSTQSRHDRRARHLAAADYLSSLPDPSSDLALVISRHLLDAVDSSSPHHEGNEGLEARASTLLEQAATRTRALGSPREAVRIADLALQHTSDLTTQARLHTLAAESALDGGAFDEAITHGAAAATAYDSLRDPILAGVAAATQARALGVRQQTDLARSIAQERWDALDGVPGAERALVRLARAMIQVLDTEQDRNESMLFSHRRLLLAEALGDPEELCGALTGHSVGYGLVGAPVTSIALLRASASIAREHDLPGFLGGALFNLCAALVSRDLPQALAAGREAVDASRRSGVRQAIEFALINYALALWTAGRLTDMDDLLATATDIALPNARVSLPALTGWLREANGTLPTHEPIPEPDEGSADLPFLGTIKIMNALSAGDYDALPDLVRTTMQHTLNAHGIDDDFAHIWPRLVNAALDIGDVDLADSLLHPVETAGPGMISAEVAGHYQVLRGRVLAAQGREPNEAEAHLRRGIVALDDFGAIGLAACARQSLGEWLLTQDRIPDAEEALLHAKDTYQRIGAQGWVRRLEHLSNRSPGK